MKKLFTLIALVGIAFSANAQRKIDMQALLTSPTTGTHIDTSSVFNLNLVIKNNGPIALTTADTFGFKVTLKGSALRIGTDTILAFTGRNFNVGDTMQFNLSNVKLTYSLTPSGNYDMCAVFVAVQNRTSPIIDTNTNDASCSTLAMWGLDVPSISANIHSVNMYPNPAQSDVNFDLNLNNSGDVTIRVMDVTGRIVLNENKGNLSAGTHKLKLNTVDLSNGVYVYQVMVGAETTTGRFSISK